MTEKYSKILRKVRYLASIQVTVDNMTAPTFIMIKIVMNTSKYQLKGSAVRPFEMSTIV